MLPCAAAALADPLTKAMVELRSASRPCPGRCGNELDLSAFAPAERRTLVLCPDCDAKVECKVQSEGMHWFTAHLDPTHVSWSSHPHILPPSKPPCGTERDTGVALDSGIKTAAAAMLAADAILVVAGAGASCDSGLPDFRGEDGFYKHGSRAIQMEDVDFHDVQRLPTAWWWMLSMKKAFLQASPHSGYHALRRILQRRQHYAPTTSAMDFFIFTSNIDSYFRRALFPEEKLYETHGSLDFLQCTTVGNGEAIERAQIQGGNDDDEGNVALKSKETRRPPCEAGVWAWTAARRELGAGSERGDEVSATVESAAVSTVDELPSDRAHCNALLSELPALDHDSLSVSLDDARLPRCATCGARARPNVSHATDLDEHIHMERKGAQNARLTKWLALHAAEGSNSRMVVLEVGCGTSVHSLREETDLLLDRVAHASVVRIDPSDASVPSGRGVGLLATAQEALEALERTMHVQYQAQRPKGDDVDAAAGGNGHPRKKHKKYAPE